MSVTRGLYPVQEEAPKTEPKTLPFETQLTMMQLILKFGERLNRTRLDAETLREGLGPAASFAATSLHDDHAEITEGYGSISPSSNDADDGSWCEFQREPAAGP